MRVLTIFNKCDTIDISKIEEIFMETSILILFYLFIMSSINAFIDIDMKMISKRLISGIPFADSILVLVTGGIYAILYLRKREQIKRSCESLYYLLMNYMDPITESLIQAYDSYMESNFKLHDPFLDGLLKDIAIKIKSAPSTNVR